MTTHSPPRTDATRIGIQCINLMKVCMSDPFVMKLRRRLAPHLQRSDVIRAFVCTRILRALMAQTASCFGQRTHVVPLEPLLERMLHHADVRGSVMQQRRYELDDVGAGEDRLDAIVRGS